jgi:hypothetical protein
LGSVGWDECCCCNDEGLAKARNVCADIITPAAILRLLAEQLPLQMFSELPAEEIPTEASYFASVRPPTN